MADLRPASRHNYDSVLFTYLVELTVKRHCNQGDHLSGKPGNVREFDSCQGNVRDFAKSQGKSCQGKVA